MFLFASRHWLSFALRALFASRHWSLALRALFASRALFVVIGFASFFVFASRHTGINSKYS
jgi:hypothetical protein